MINPAAQKDSEEIDLLAVAHKLQESGMSVKQTQRCWEQFRKRLRDVQKKECEFLTATRQRITQCGPQFCEDQQRFFKARHDKIYQDKLAAKDGVLGQLGKCEDSLKQLLSNYNGVLSGQGEGNFESLKKDLTDCQEATDALIRDL